jgi:hypothetical protein
MTHRRNIRVISQAAEAAGLLHQNASPGMHGTVCRFTSQLTQ